MAITTDAVVVNKGRETIMTPVVPNQSGSRRNLFIAIVLILFFVIGMILVIGIIHNPKDAQNGQLQFTVYPQDVHFWCEIDNQRVSGEFLNSYIAEQLYTKKETHYRIGADGFQTYEGSVIANPDFQNIDIQLIPASVTKLKMFVDADGATVKVDGEKLDGIKHFEFADITPGEHLVTVTKEGYKPEEKKIFIKSGEELSLSFELKPAFAMLVLKATPYPAKYSIRNVRTGEVVKEGTTNSSGERISQLPIDDRFEIAIYDGDTVIKRSWKPNTDVAIDEDQVLSVTTQHSPNAVAQAQEPSAPSAVAKSTSSSTKSTSSGTSSKKTTQNTSADTSKKPQQPAAAPSPAPAAETSKIPGILLVNSIPPAQIFIDGKNYGETFKKIELPAGTYTIRFVNKEQGINTEQSVTVEAGKKVKVMRQ